VVGGMFAARGRTGTPTRSAEGIAFIGRSTGPCGGGGDGTVRHRHTRQHTRQGRRSGGWRRRFVRYRSVWERSSRWDPGLRRNGGSEEAPSSRQVSTTDPQEARLLRPMTDVSSTRFLRSSVPTDERV